MFKLACILAGLAFCQALVIGENSVLKEPKKEVHQAADRGCCLPNEWQSLVLQTVATESSYIKLFLQMAANVTKKSYGIRVYDESFKLQERLVKDFTNSKLYTITDQGCQTSDLDEDFGKCISGDYYVGSAYSGAGSHSLPSHSYQFKHKIQGVTYNSLMTVNDECFPLGESLNAGSTNIFLAYFNGTMSVTDPTIFDIPSSCH